MLSCSASTAISRAFRIRCRRCWHKRITSRFCAGASCSQYRRSSRERRQPLQYPRLLTSHTPMQGLGISKNSSCLITAPKSILPSLSFGKTRWSLLYRSSTSDAALTIVKQNRINFGLDIAGRTPVYCAQQTQQTLYIVFGCYKPALHLFSLTLGPKVKRPQPVSRAMHRLLPCGPACLPIGHIL